MAKGDPAHETDFDFVFRTLHEACGTPFASWVALADCDRVRLRLAPQWPLDEAADEAIAPANAPTDKTVAEQYRFFCHMFMSNWVVKDQSKKRLVSTTHALLPNPALSSSTMANRALANPRGASLLLLDHGSASKDADPHECGSALCNHLKTELRALYLQYAALETQRDLIVKIGNDTHDLLAEQLGLRAFERPATLLFSNKKYWTQFYPLEKSRSFNRTCNRIAQEVGYGDGSEAKTELPLVAPRAPEPGAPFAPVPTMPKKADSRSTRSQRPTSEAVKYRAKCLVISGLQDSATLLMDARSDATDKRVFETVKELPLTGAWLWGFTQGNAADDARREPLAADAREQWLAAGQLLADWLLACATGANGSERAENLRHAVEGVVERLDDTGRADGPTGELDGLLCALSGALDEREGLGCLMTGVLYSLVHGPRLEQAGLGASSLQKGIGTIFVGDTPAGGKVREAGGRPGITLIIASGKASNGAHYSPATCPTIGMQHIAVGEVLHFGRSPQPDPGQEAHAHTLILDDPAISRHAGGLYWDGTRSAWQLSIDNLNGATADGEPLESGDIIDVAPGMRLCLRGAETNYFLLLSA